MHVLCVLCSVWVPHAFPHFFSPNNENKYVRKMVQKKTQKNRLACFLFVFYSPLAFPECFVVFDGRTSMKQQKGKISFQPFGKVKRRYFINKKKIVDAGLLSELPTFTLHYYRRVSSLHRTLFFFIGIFFFSHSYSFQHCDLFIIMLQSGCKSSSCSVGSTTPVFASSKLAVRVMRSHFYFTLNFFLAC